MNFAPLEAVANALLFEGYILYPYRPSAMKNRQRWNFGTLYPQCFAEKQNPQERWKFSAQLLIEGTEDSKLSACVRFLRLIPPHAESAHEWKEGLAQSRTVDEIAIRELIQTKEFVFNLSDRSPRGHRPVSRAHNEKSHAGRLTLRVEILQSGLFRLHATFSNEGIFPNAEVSTPKEAEDAAFVSAHLILGSDGAFVSLLEPPPEVQAEVAGCVQDGVFPVLAGEAGCRSFALCSPIILYDYPEIAPESAGDFFDGTEMDEMLALRVLTLTDEEKEEMRRSDVHARTVLERSEMLPDEQLARVHGVVRGLRRVAAHTPLTDAKSDADLIEQPFDPFAARPSIDSVKVFGVELHTGDRVRLWPQKRADILDLSMEGKIALIESIEQDLEDKLQFAVVLEDDPGRDMGILRQAGHRFFFSPEEVEPLGSETP